MSPLVYIVRHGETAWNVEYRLQGQADVPLNDEGRRQATANGLRLAQLIRNPEEFDFVASPMQRARSTMELIRAAMKLDPADYRTDPRLMEMSFGDWQGFTFAELEAQNPGSTRGRGPDKWDFVPPGKDAESYEMLLARVRPFFEELEQPTICVTHGGVIRTLFRMVAGLPKAEAARAGTPQDRVLRWEGKELEWL